MPRRLVTAAVTAVVVALAGASTAHADQATLLDFVESIPPGEAAVWTFTLVVAGAGIPNVAYENADSFVAGETVTATITPIVEPAGFGTVELVGGGTLTGTASDDWNTGEGGEIGAIVFGPELSLRYTAPSLGDLACTDHPGETFYGHVGVLADFSGETGTLAQVDPLLGGQGWVGAAVPLKFTCPPAESAPDPADPADLTPPPTDASPATAASHEARPLWALLAVLVIVGFAVVALSQIAGSRLRRSG
jgi:hypothetical protein